MQRPPLRSRPLVSRSRTRSHGPLIQPSLACSSLCVCLPSSLTSSHALRSLLLLVRVLFLTLSAVLLGSLSRSSFHAPHLTVCKRFHSEQHHTAPTPLLGGISAGSVPHPLSQCRCSGPAARTWPCARQTCSSCAHRNHLANAHVRVQLHRHGHAPGNRVLHVIFQHVFESLRIRAA